MAITFSNTPTRAADRITTFWPGRRRHKPIKSDTSSAARAAMAQSGATTIAVGLGMRVAKARR